MNAFLLFFFKCFFTQSSIQNENDNFNIALTNGTWTLDYSGLINVGVTVTQGMWHWFYFLTNNRGEKQWNLIGC